MVKFISTKELIRKALGSITTTSLSDAVLEPAQFQEFLTFISEGSVLSNVVRRVTLSQRVQDIPRLFLHDIVAEPASENTSSGNVTRPVADNVRVEAKKYRMSFYITRDMLLDNILREGFEDVVFRQHSEKFGVDIENAAINGDTALAGATDRLSQLLSQQDGWAKLAESGHVVDWFGGTVSKDLFAQALRRMPSIFKQGQLRWIMSEGLWNDWLDLLSTRATPAGDRALEGQIIGPFGIPVIKVPLIPDDLPLQLTSGLPAEIYGTTFGPWEIQTGVNDTLILSINGGPNRTIVFQPGVLHSAEAAAAINAVLSAAGDTAIAVDDTEGRLVIRTTNIGATASIAVQSGSTAAITLGIQGAGLPNVANGANAGTPGQLREGTFLMLTDPRNLIWGVFDEVTVTRQYNAEFDRLEVFVYAYFGFAIENANAVVKVKNIRVRSLV